MKIKFRGRNDREMTELWEDLVGWGVIVLVMTLLILASGLDH